MSLPGGYSAFIPLGRTFDPLTDKGWEGTGIEPAEQALDEVLKRSGIAKTGAESLAGLR